jgi:hypothetical protein
MIIESANNSSGPKTEPLLDKDPRDKGRIMEIIYLIYGMSVLLPWNAILTSLPYYESNVSYSFALLTLLIDAWSFSFIRLPFRLKLLTCDNASSCNYIRIICGFPS